MQIQNRTQTRTLVEIQAKLIELSNRLDKVEDRIIRNIGRGSRW